MPTTVSGVKPIQRVNANKAPKHHGGTALGSGQPPMCELCGGLGYVMQDVGTATIPDYIEAPCRCNPHPTDFDYPEFDCPVIDYDPPIRDRDVSLPSWLLA